MKSVISLFYNLLNILSQHILSPTLSLENVLSFTLISFYLSISAPALYQSFVRLSGTFFSFVFYQKEGNMGDNVFRCQYIVFPNLNMTQNIIISKL